MATASFGYRFDTTSAIVVLDREESGAPGDYERAFARQERELREARAQIAALMRQQNELASLRNLLEQLHFAREDASARISALSGRQRQIMDMVLAGGLSKTIAWELGISQRTVENHRAEIMKRTGVRSLPALARVALAAACDTAGRDPGRPLAALALDAIRVDEPPACSAAAAS